jgi:hypothetical protein
MSNRFRARSRARCASTPIIRAARAFPGRPVVPGVVLLEAVLEAAAELLGHEPVVAQLAQAKFLAPLLPGQDASIELALQGEGLDFRVLRAGAPLAQGRFVLRGRPARESFAATARTGRGRGIGVRGAGPDHRRLERAPRGRRRPRGPRRSCGSRCRCGRPATRLLLWPATLYFAFRRPPDRARLARVPDPRVRPARAHARK